MLEGRPSYIPRPGGKGAKALGRAYEKKVGKFISRRWPGLISGQWFEFLDRNGPGVCQPDHYIPFEDQVLLFECKLTQTDVAFSQMDQLYKPILRQLYGRPVTGVQVCKHLVDRRPIITDLRETLLKPGSNFLWHCLL